MKNRIEAPSILLITRKKKKKMDRLEKMPDNYSEKGVEFQENRVLEE